MILESKLQTKIIRYLNTVGKAIKLVSPSGRGHPDIMAIIDGKVWLFEVKTPTGVVSPLQEYQITEWRKHGANAYIVRSLEEVKSAIAGLSA